jgi:xylulokinase
MTPPAARADATTRYVLAVDLGTGGPKVGLVSTGGDVVAHTQGRTRLILLDGGGAEQDPEEWWQTIVAGVRDLVGRNVVPVDDIVAISVTTQWMGTVAVGRDGRPLMNALIWMDSRGAPYSTRLTGGGLEVPGTKYNARRLWRWLRLTGGLPSRTGKDPVGHILWLEHERPEVYAATATFLEPMDYLNLRLTGRPAASYDSATGYWSTDNRDLSRVRYVPELVRMGGLDRSRLPDLLPTGAVLGTVTPAVAAELGIGEHVQVVMGTGDTASAGIGAGAVRHYEPHLYVGTSSWLSCHVPFKKTDVFSSITSLPSGVPGSYWVATEQEMAGKCLTWLVDNVLYPDDGLTGGDTTLPAGVLDRLNTLAGGVAPGSGSVIFAPWLNGERTPVEDHLIRGGWFNVSLTTDRGAQSALWCQIMADVLGRPIHQVDEPALANVRGAGLCAAVALGYLRWDDIPQRITVAATYEPNPRLRGMYDRLFRAFTDIYRRNRRLYASMNRQDRAPTRRSGAETAAETRPATLTSRPD